MWCESIAIVAVNGFLYLYQFVYLQNKSLFDLLESFAIYTSVQLVIEWFFTSVSLAIETRYQYGCDGCLAKTMEEAHFRGDSKCGANSFSDKCSLVSYSAYTLSLIVKQTLYNICLFPDKIEV